ncbi:MAG: hypothetical protein C4306_10990, partial [Thermoleophilia bacterium]
MPAEDRLRFLWLVAPSRRVLCGGQALVALIQILEGGGWRASLARRAQGGLERAYALVARHRGLLGRLVPDGPAP